MFRRLLWIAGPVAVLSFGVYRWGPTRATALPSKAVPSAASSPDDERLAALERQVSSLRAELVSERQRRERDPDPVAPISSSGEPDQQPLAKQAATKIEEEAARAAAAEFYQDLSDRVDTEPQDPTWRRQVEADIDAVLPRELGPEVQVTEANCASTTCRVQLKHPTSPRIPQESIMKLARNRGPLNTLEWHLDLRKDGETTLYMARPTSLQEK